MEMHWAWPQFAMLLLAFIGMAKSLATEDKWQNFVAHLIAQFLVNGCLLYYGGFWTAVRP